MSQFIMIAEQKEEIDIRDLWVVAARLHNQLCTVTRSNMISLSYRETDDRTRNKMVKFHLNKFNLKYQCDICVDISQRAKHEGLGHIIKGGLKTQISVSFVGIDIVTQEENEKIEKETFESKTLKTFSGGKTSKTGRKRNSYRWKNWGFRH